MTILDRLERHLSRFAIPGLIRYVVAFNALAYLLGALNPGYLDVLQLDRGEILNGEVWRLFTWIFLPTAPYPILVFIYLWVTWWIGDALEAEWGTFRLNAYYFLGMALCILSAFVFGQSLGNSMLNLTLFLALASIMPNMEILLFFVLPLKFKWAAWISMIWPILILLTGPISDKMMVVVCMGNYLLFFGPQFLRDSRSKRQVATRRARFEAAKDISETLHRCQACGITEISHPQADFRVAADGHEYCTAHLPARAP